LEKREQVLQKKTLNAYWHNTPQTCKIEALKLTNTAALKIKLDELLDNRKNIKDESNDEYKKTQPLLLANF
jgi:hypothetical protein